MNKRTLHQDLKHSSPYRQVVDVNGYEIYFDLPEAMGGSGTAPNPHAYLDAAVLGCKAMVMRLFANRRGLPLEDIQITLNSDDSEERKGRYVMNFEIKLIGEQLTDKNRENLFKIAEQCPVGKLLTDEAEVTLNSRLV